MKPAEEKKKKKEKERNEEVKILTSATNEAGAINQTLSMKYDSTLSKTPPCRMSHPIRHCVDLRSASMTQPHPHPPQTKPLQSSREY